MSMILELHSVSDASLTRVLADPPLVWKVVLGVIRDRPCFKSGVRQPAAQQTAHPLHAARAGEGGWTVEAVLPGAQHRKARAPRIRELGKLA